MINEISKLSSSIKIEAKKLGFFDCGISEVKFLSDDAEALEVYLEKGMNAGMEWLSLNFDKRTNPEKLLKNAKSVISVIYSYNSEDKPKDPAAPKISKYAFGKNYHKVLKDKLYLLLEVIRKMSVNCNARIFVDSGPVLEKAWARSCGIGWIGKHSLLINPLGGSYFFIGEIITDLVLEYDKPIEDKCYDCTLCIDSCPTSAITGKRTIDANKCISYLTIELEDKIPASFKGKLNNWVCGCDICQNICPWNKINVYDTESPFKPNPVMLEMKKKDWFMMDEEL
ncbi:tRNA epoxyqueuosine(34) reductase QueG, partial [Bacteroidota bacterium]